MKKTNKSKSESVLLTNIDIEQQRSKENSIARLGSEDHI